MKTLFVVLGLMFGAVLFTLFALEDPGFVMMGRGNWTLETSLAAFLLALFVLGFLTYQSTRILSWLGAIPHYFTTRYSRYHQRKATQALFNALSATVQNQWQVAEDSALKTVSTGELGALHYLIAAYAATQQQSFHVAQAHFVKALELLPQHAVSLYLWQAQVQTQPVLALNAALDAYQQAPKNPQVLQVLASLYLHLADWEALVKLLPELRKRKVAPNEHLASLEQHVQLALLQRQLQTAENLTVAANIWAKLPKTQRLQANFVRIYASYLQAQGDMESLEALLREVLRYHWDKPLLKMYAGIKSADLPRQLQFAESLLKQYPNDVDLFEALGRLHLHAHQIDKAIFYLRASLELQSSAAIHYLLGEIFQQQQDNVQACVHYQQGLALALAENNLIFINRISQLKLE
ncbi:MAG: heme biosynthesis HemY N-terminal domain-containing protein [Thiotrichaceae bacterium]|nr:heme biosynthesis HemY N-terminal domain-containing protein [Thiotrichaceae bacterium]